MYFQNPEKPNLSIMEKSHSTPFFYWVNKNLYTPWFETLGTLSNITFGVTWLKKKKGTIMKCLHVKPSKSQIRCADSKLYSGNLDSLGNWGRSVFFYLPNENSWWKTRFMRSEENVQFEELCFMFWRDLCNDQQVWANLV